MRIGLGVLGFIENIFREWSEADDTTAEDYKHGDKNYWSLCISFIPLTSLEGDCDLLRLGVGILGKSKKGDGRWPSLSNSFSS